MSMITFEELKAKHQNKLSLDQEVSCKLLAKLKEGYLVDINDEWEGFIPNSHIITTIETELLLEPFKALVISGPDRTDRYMVSQRALKEKAVWESLQKLKEENKPFKVTISKVIKGGVEVYIDSVRAFLPGRYIRLIGISQDNWVNQEIDVLIEELDYKEKKIILNQKKAIDLDKQQKAEVAIQRLKEGDIVEAPVLRIAKFGVFVDLGGLDGLIPASELSWGRFNHPKDIIKEGQVVKARIFRIEKEHYRVALSIKQLLGEPWEQIDSDWEVGNHISGKVISEAPFGLFVELSPGIEALLHNSEIAEGLERPKVGSTIWAKIIKIDLEQRKIGLSLRDIEQRTESREQKSEISKKSEEIEDAKEGTDSSINVSTPSEQHISVEKDEDELSIALSETTMDDLPLCNLETPEEELKTDN